MRHHQRIPAGHYMEYFAVGNIKGWCRGKEQVRVLIFRRSTRDMREQQLFLLWRGKRVRYENELEGERKWWGLASYLGEMVFPQTYTWDSFLAWDIVVQWESEADSWVSLVAQMVKNLPTMWETQVQSMGKEDPLEKGMAIHSSILALRITWTEEPGRQ